MKQLTILLLAICFLGLAIPTKAQQQSVQFTGAEATLNSYKALYILNDGDDKKISGILKSIKNALDDPRLKGKLEIELVVFGDGVKLFEKGGNYEERLKELNAKGVILAQCENTLRQRKISKDSLFPFISFVPTANGEIIIRQHQGWAIVQL